MTKKLTSIGLTLSLLFAVSTVLAKSNSIQVTNPSSNTFSLPTHAVQVADNVFSLGQAIDPATGQLAQGYAIIHYRQAFHHRPGHNGGPGGGGEVPTCYTYVFEGKTKWKSVEGWVTNTANTRGLGSAFVFDTITAGIAKWENAAGVNILGDGTITNDSLFADSVSPDNQNEVYFADIAEDGAIGVTIVWKTIFKNQLIEWDQIYDDIDFDWSSDGSAGKMDFDNIATHELGHSVGMGDIYNVACSNVTMYGFADFGETNKRTLEPADITGVSALY